VDYLVNVRKLNEMTFMEDFIANILIKREQKYLIPVR
jgi:hypothetical protein